MCLTINNSNEDSFCCLTNPGRGIPASRFGGMNVSSVIQVASSVSTGCRFPQPYELYVMTRLQSAETEEVTGMSDETFLPLKTLHPVKFVLSITDF